MNPGFQGLIDRVSETVSVLTLNKDKNILSSLDTHDLAERFRALDKISTAVDEGTKLVKPILIDRKASEFFPEVNATALFDYLFKAGRMWDFVKVASITQASLAKLEDHEVLNAMFVKETGQAASSCSAKSMTKEEIARWEASQRLNG